MKHHLFFTNQNNLTNLLVLVLIFVFSFTFIPLKFYPSVSLSYGGIKEERKEAEDILKKVENPDKKSEEEARKLVRSFFSDTGLKILTCISLALFVISFFRLRNYHLAIIFYLLANFFIFLGYKISTWLFK
ncbi:MAG: hypothetical protein ACP5QP_06115 [Brevinematia bacterium]